MSGRILSGWAVFLILAPAAAGAALPEKTAKPRDLSEAERAAVELAAAYLQGGPPAWWERLAAGSPLRRSGRETALAEIAARVGPADGATWQLLTPGHPDRERAVFGVEYPSGLEETLTLRLVQEGGWKLAEIRTTADPRDGAPGGSPAPSPAAAPEGPPRRGLAAALPFATPYFTLGLAGLALLAGALAALALARAGKKGLAAGAGAAAGGIVAGALLWTWAAGRQAAPGAATAGGGAGGKTADRAGDTFAALAPLRAALAAGSDRAEIEKRLVLIPGDPRRREVQQLWRAQYLLGEGDLTGAEALLKGFPDPAPYPLADLLRARLAFRRMRREETSAAYDQALHRGSDDDGVRLESAIAAALTDDEVGAEIDFQAMVEMGSRRAEPWYVVAQLAASQDKMEQAEAFLHRAWQLEPAPRAELFANPLFAALVARPNLFPLFQLGAPEEARVTPETPAGARRPLALPASATAATCGQSLRLVLGSAVLLVPGGAELAPEGAVEEDAGTWSGHAEAKALAALPALRAQAAAGGALQPRFLRLAEEAGRALAREHRWSELVGLTDPLAAAVESAPSYLVRLRAQALHHLVRDDEARQLLVRLAKSDIAGRRPSAATLFELADLFAAAGEYDTAIKLVTKADSQLPAPRGQRRRRQLALDRELATSYASFRSDHFDVRFPKATGERYARQVAWVLEEERTRLARWIPAGTGGGGKRIEVHLFPLKDFFASFGGDVAVVGLFDGKMRVPFAELRSLHPRLVAILSHELAHALIADATHDQAPHWVQEGVAQHVEMGAERVNPLPDLAKTGRALSFPTLDLILRGFAEEQLVGLAYNEAAWTMAFLEARFGERAIPRLLAAFAAGRTTEQALKETFGLTPAELDRAFWAWGTGPAPRVRNLEPRRYDQDYVALERHEKQAAAVATPRVGLRADDQARRQSEADELRRRMTAWHAVYYARTASLKLALKPILEVYSGNRNATQGNTAAACRDLSVEVRKALEQPEVWASPDPELNRELQNAYSEIAALGDDCRMGRDAEARARIRKIGATLNQATQRLAPYGLIP